MKKTEWTYYNLHNVLRVRVEKGHPSEYAARFVFGPFQTDPLDEVDLSLQFEPPGIGQHCIASYSYLFTENHVYLKQYKMHIARDGAAFVLAGKRDLVPYIGPVMQWLLMQKDHSMVHSAAVAVGGRGILLPGWGGTGKTSAIICLLKDVADTSFLSDDYTILSAKGELLAYPKAFFIYPYHRGLFPHLFKAKHKPLVPPVLSGLLCARSVWRFPGWRISPGASRQNICRYRHASHCRRQTSAIEHRSRPCFSWNVTPPTRPSSTEWIPPRPCRRWSETGTTSRVAAASTSRVAAARTPFWHSAPPLSYPLPNTSLKWRPSSRRRAAIGQYSA